MAPFQRAKFFNIDVPAARCQVTEMCSHVDLIQRLLLSAPADIVSHNSASLLALCVRRKQKLNTGRFSIVCMEADGATCPFTTGLFCIPNFRPLKQTAEASVQHCADGWMILKNTKKPNNPWYHSEKDRVVNRWAHCF